MTNKKPMTLTSVKVQTDLFNDFKIECVKRKFSFQKLADRTLFLYLTDEDFRKKITNQIFIFINQAPHFIFFSLLYSQKDLQA